MFLTHLQDYCTTPSIICQFKSSFIQWDGSPVTEKLKNYATGTHGKDFLLFNQIHLEQISTLQCTCCVTLNMGLGAGNMTQWLRAFAVLTEYLSLGCQHLCQVSQHPVTPVLDLSPQVSEATCTHVHTLTWRHTYPFLGYLH